MHQPVCILIMAHSHEELLLNLHERLQHPQVRVFVHIDKKSQALYDKLSSQTSMQLIKERIDVQWAHITQLQAYFSSYREIVAAGHQFDHFIVISGQDYPIVAPGKIVEFLTTHKNKSMISFVPLSKDGWTGAMKRFHYHYYIRMEKLWRGLMMLTGIRRQFPFGLKPYGGSQWINLCRKHMDYVIEFCDKHVSLMNFMATVRFPEEMLIQTLLQNSEYKNDCINDDMRYIKWTHGKSNPEILAEEHYREIMNAGVKFFARKVDLKQSASLIALLNEKNT